MSSNTVDLLSKSANPKTRSPIVATAALKPNVTDVMISILGWFNFSHKAFTDAGAIGNLSGLHPINNITATALSYGITKFNFPEAKTWRTLATSRSPKPGVVLSLSHKGWLAVESTAYKLTSGGRDLKFTLVKHFATEF